MTIEKSPAPTANASTASANRSEGKGKTGSDDGSGGFGAILSAVDNPPTAPEAAADASADGQNAKSGKPAKPGKAAPDATAVDPNTLLQQNPQIAAAQAQQTAAEAAAAAAAAHAQTAGTAQVAADPATLAQQAALNAAQQAGTNLPQSGQTATPSANPATTALPAAARGAGRGTPGAPDSTVALDTAAGTGATGSQSLLQAHAKAGKDALQAGLDAKSQTAQASQAGQATSTASNQAAGAERADAARFMAALQQAQTPQGNRAAETALAPLVAKTDKPQTERSGTVKTADPTYTGTALGVSGPDFSQTLTQVNAVPPETQVAEQVSYWVTHNVQNAELQLDGLGKDPVAVSISVQGNEAQITFRSDESATRDILQNSGSHLKDLLQREGLVLTGVSVDSSGSQSAQSRGDQSGRQNARQTTIAPLQVSSQDTSPRLRSGIAGSTGRSVDLFV